MKEITLHYISRWGRKAIMLLITYGELIRGETRAFEERYGFDREEHLLNLRKLIQRVGGQSRDL